MSKDNLSASGKRIIDGKEYVVMDEFYKVLQIVNVMKKKIALLEGECKNSEQKTQENAELTRQLDGMKDLLEEKEKQIAQMSMQLVESNKSIQSRDSRIDEMQRNEEDQKEKTLRLIKGYKQKLDKSNGDFEELKSKMASECERMMKEIQELKQKLSEEENKVNDVPDHSELEELNALKEEMTEIKSENGRYVEMLSEKDCLCENITVENEQLNQKICELQTELSKLKEEMEVFYKQQPPTDATAMKQETELEVVSRVNEKVKELTCETEKRVQMLEQELIDRKGLLDARDEEIKKLSLLCEEKVSSISQCEQRQSELNLQICTLQNNRLAEQSDFEKQLDQLNQRLSESSTNSNILRQEIEKLNEVLSENRATERQIKSQRDQLSEELRDIKEQNGLLNNNELLLNTRIHETNERNESLNEKLRQALDRETNLLKQLDELRLHSIESSQDTKCVEDSMKNQLHELQQSHSQLLESKKNLEMERDELMSKMQDHQMKETSHQQQTDQLTVQVQEMTEQIRELNCRNDEALKQYESEKVLCDEKLRQVESDRTASDQQMEQMRELMNQQQQQYDSGRVELQQLEKQNHELQESLAEEQKKLSLLREESQTLLDQKNSELKDHQDKYTQLLSQMSSKESDLENVHASNHVVEQQIHDLETQIESLNRQLAVSNENSTERHANLEKQVKELTNTHESLSNQLSKALLEKQKLSEVSKNQAEEYEKKIGDLQQFVSKLESDLNNQMGEVDNVKSLLTNSEAINTSLKEKMVSDSNSMLAVLAERENQIAQLLAKEEEARAKFSQLKQMGNTLADSQKQCDALNARIKSLENELNASKQQETKLKALINRSTNILKENNQQAGRIEELEAQLENTHQQIIVQNQAIVQLQSNESELSTRVNDLVAQLTEGESLIAQLKETIILSQSKERELTSDLENKQLQIDHAEKIIRSQGDELKLKKQAELRTVNVLNQLKKSKERLESIVSEYSLLFVPTIVPFTSSSGSGPTSGASVSPVPNAGDSNGLQQVVNSNESLAEQQAENHPAETTSSCPRIEVLLHVSAGDEDWVYVKVSSKQDEGNNNNNHVRKWMLVNSVLVVYPDLAIPPELTQHFSSNMSSLSQESESTKSRLQKLQQEYDSYKAKSKLAAAKLKEQVSQQTAQVNSLTSEKEKQACDSEELKEQLKKAEEQQSTMCIEKDKLMGELQSKYQSLSEEHLRNVESMDVLKEENAHLSGQLSTSQAKVLQLTQSLESAQSQLKQATIVRHDHGSMAATNQHEEKRESNAAVDKSTTVSDPGNVSASVESSASESIISPSSIRSSLRESYRQGENAGNMSVPDQMLRTALKDTDEGTIGLYELPHKQVIELRKMLDGMNSKVELLSNKTLAMEQEISLKDKYIMELSGDLERVKLGSNEPDLIYLRHTLVKFFCDASRSEQTKLAGVIGKLIQLSPDQQKQMEKNFGIGQRGWFF